jgi:hypothetical protein
MWLWRGTQKIQSVDHDHGVRPRLWTAATNGPIVHLTRDICVWRATVEWCRQGKHPDSSIGALWQSYQQSSCCKAGKTGKGNDKFCLTKYLFRISKGSLTCRKILRHGADGFTSAPKKGVLRILSPLKIHHSGQGLNPRISGPMASTLTTRPRRTTHRVPRRKLLENVHWKIKDIERQY